MMFDDLETTQKQLIGQVKAVCKALKYIRSVTALDTLPRLQDGSVNPKYTKWCEQMNIANTARVEIEMAGEYIRAELSDENYDKNIEWKQLEKELERMRKKKATAARRNKQKTSESAPA
jgi:hypothetical protein